MTVSPAMGRIGSKSHLISPVLAGTNKSQLKQISRAGWKAELLDLRIAEIAHSAVRKADLLIV